jgi:hypothetical protein
LYRFSGTRLPRRLKVSGNRGSLSLRIFLSGFPLTGITPSGCFRTAAFPRNTPLGAGSGGIIFDEPFQKPGKKIELILFTGLSLALLSPKALG